jgi:hypothetical protein
MTLAEMKRTLADLEAKYKPLNKKLDQLKYGELPAARKQKDGRYDYHLIERLSKEIAALEATVKPLEEQVCTLTEQVKDTENPLLCTSDVFFNDLAQAEPERTWLVDNILVADEVALWAGPRKTLKTSIAVDLALSLATGKPFLDRFTVPQAVRVMFLSGESGRSTIRETALRIAAHKGIADVSALEVLWGSHLPAVSYEEIPATYPTGYRWSVRIGDREYKEGRGVGLPMKEVVRDYAPRVVIIDPLYITLASKCHINASSLFEMGPPLAALAKACHPATPILLHHSTKELRPGQVMALEDAAFAGCQEFARQWFLVNRRRVFKPDQEQDVHELVVLYGGSAGHNGTFALDVDEGKQTRDLRGRVWKPTVLTLAEAKQKDAEARKQQAQQKKEKLQSEHIGKLLAVLPLDGSPISFTKARELSRLNTNNLNLAIEQAGEQVKIDPAPRGQGRLVRRSAPTPAGPRAGAIAAGPPKNY